MFKVSIQLVHIYKGNPNYVLETFARLVCYSLSDLKGFVLFNYTSVYRSKIYNQALIKPIVATKINK